IKRNTASRKRSNRVIGDRPLFLLILHALPLNLGIHRLVFTFLALDLVAVQIMLHLPFWSLLI
ncbi:MAG: hypothetical protein O7C59_12210, partial [Rickettsia endosymbiont of Ixodes persulcatus]|nr:hypothetical protein [Rickettsia endosymbiont of Ixodes persulcatus]